jgi:hypothetical protein
MVRARFVSIDSLEIAEQRAMDAIERYQLENELFELKHSLSVQDSSQSEEEFE